jgi:flagellar hook-associated protein 2
MATTISSLASTASTASTTSTASTAASLTAPLFQASGLASGLDTTSIVNELIQADSAPLNSLKQRQSDYQVQISTLGTLVTQLQAFNSAASSLSTNGVVSIQPTTTSSDFTVTGSASAEGSYDITVSKLAKEAKLRSASFTSAQDATVVPSGNLQFSVDGTSSVAIDTTGKTLADIAEAINQNVSQVNASVISTDTGYYLSVARKTTGYATTADAALTVVSDPGLHLAVQQTAQNAQISVDGLTVSRPTNNISDVIPGVTLNLTGNSNADNHVVFAANSSGTETGLNAFVSAYNTLAATLHSQLVTDPTVAYGDTLLDHSTTAEMQNSMQELLSQTVVGSGSVRTLADLGLELQQDGTLSLNVITLNNAISTNPSAANAIFSTATTGIAASVKALSDAQTNSATGSLIGQETSLQSSISDMTDRETEMQSNLDAERTRLTSQFTAMEQLVSGFTTAGSYLTQLANLKIGS